MFLSFFTGTRGIFRYAQYTVTHASTLGTALVLIHMYYRHPQQIDERDVLDDSPSIVSRYAGGSEYDGFHCLLLTQAVPPMQ